MKKSEFAVNILREYAKESGSIMVRSTSDLSPLEEWLIVKMYQKETINKRDTKEE